MFLTTDETQIKHGWGKDLFGPVRAGWFLGVVPWVNTHGYSCLAISWLVQKAVFPLIFGCIRQSRLIFEKRCRLAKTPGRRLGFPWSGGGKSGKCRVRGALDAGRRRKSLCSITRIYTHLHDF